MSKDNIEDVMLDLFSQFDWVVKTGDEQKSGSSADIYAEHIDEFDKYMMDIVIMNCMMHYIIYQQQLEKYSKVQLKHRKISLW